MDIKKIKAYLDTLPDTIDEHTDPPLGIEGIDFLDGLSEICAYWLIEQTCEENKKLLFQVLENHWLNKSYHLKNPLHYAAYRGHLPAVKAFKAMGFKSSAENEGCTALHYAAFSGNCTLIALLIEQHDLDPLALDEQGNTVLAWAEKGKQEKAIDLCGDKERLSAMRQRYLDERTAVVNVMPDITPQSIQNIIAEYALATDFDHTTRRISNKFVSLQDEEEDISQFWSFRLRCVIAFALIGGLTFAVGIAIMMLTPIFSPTIVILSLFDTVVSLLSIYAGVKHRPEAHQPLATEPTYHYASLRTMKKWADHNQNQGNELYRTLDLGFLSQYQSLQSGVMILLGAFLILLALLDPLAFPALLPLAISTTALGVTRGLLTLYSLYKVDQQNHLIQECHDEIAAMPVY